jgi:hypothetical protein
VVDEEARPDIGAGMYLYAGNKTRDMRQQTPGQAQAMIPEPMGKAVKLERVESGITRYNFQRRARRRVSIEYRLYVLLQIIKHGFTSIL